MSPKANLSDSAILLDLWNALSRYQWQIQECLDSVEPELRRASDWIIQKELYWRKEVETSQRKLAQAKNNLERCRSRQSRSNLIQKACVTEEKQVFAAQNALFQANQELGKANHWKNEVLNAIEQYSSKKVTHLAQIEKICSQGLGLLQQKIEIINSYSEDELEWNHIDGSRDHAIFGQAVEDALDDPDKKAQRKAVSVYSNAFRNVKNEEEMEKNGFADSVIEHDGKATILEYKTDDMSRWTVAEAQARGDDYGRQVQSYVQSKDSPLNCKGYIIAVGRPPIDDLASQEYIKTLTHYDINVIFTKGGDISDVVNAAKEAMEMTKKALK
jgi:hypothetical protein